MTNWHEFSIAHPKDIDIKFTEDKQYLFYRCGKYYLKSFPKVDGTIENRNVLEDGEWTFLPKNQNELKEERYALWKKDNNDRELREKIKADIMVEYDHLNKSTMRKFYALVMVIIIINLIYWYLR